MLEEQEGKNRGKGASECVVRHTEEKKVFKKIRITNES